MASNVEDTLMKLDRLHSVDYKNDEVQLIKSKIEGIVHQISNRIGELNPILSNSVVHCGSFYHNSKINAPDEFDFLLVLNKFSQPGVCSCKPFEDPEYTHLVSLEIDNTKLNWNPQSVLEWEEDAANKQTLLQATINSEYRNAVCSCLATMSLPDGISLTTSQKSVRRRFEGGKEFLANFKFSGPALTLLLNWKGVYYPNLNISVDVTYVIAMRGLPSFCNLDKRLPSEHPIVKAGLCADASHELLYCRMLDDTWKQTCSVLENKIICFWFKENDASNVCYRLLKIIRNLVTPVDQLGEAFLKTYALKTLFLYECEQFPDSKFWRTDELSTHLLTIFQKLLSAIQNRFLPNYFNKNQNALCYPLDSRPEDENEEGENKFISSVYEAMCKIIEDIISSLEKGLASEQTLKFYFEPGQEIVIKDPDIQDALEKEN